MTNFDSMSADVKQNRLDVTLYSNIAKVGVVSLNLIARAGFVR